MQKFFSVVAASAALTAGALVATPAAAVNFIGNFNVANYQSGANGGLDIDLSRTTGSLNFNLNSVGSVSSNYTTVKLFDIWAGETIDSGDFEWDPIKINFTFTAPTTSSAVNGVTGGVEGDWIIWPIWKEANEGQVKWTSTGTFNFGNSGVMKVQLNDTSFGKSNDKGEVTAKFWVEKMPVSAVPEPGTWALMITGFGLAGAALRRRRSEDAVAA